MTQLPPHFVRNCSSFGALTWLVWDSLITCDHEYQYIWKGRTTGVKRLYLFSRYFAICSQIANSIAMLGPLASTRIRSQVCAAWFSFQTISFLCVFTTLEMVLSLRLYALYRKSRNIGVMLVLAILAGIGISAACGVRTLHRLHFDEACNAPKTPYEVIYFSTFALARHAFLWILTIHKRNVGRQAGSGRAPIVRLMLRDGASIFAAVSVVYATIVPYSYLIHVAAYVIFPWPISFLSILTCRLILNMQRLRTRTTASIPELTTNFEPDDSQTECDTIGSPRTSHTHVDYSNSKAAQ